MAIIKATLPTLALLLALCPRADAGGFAASRFGGELGHPATDHPTAIYFNPAGLALASGTHLYLEGMFIYRSASYDRDPGAIDSIIPTGETGTGTPEEAISANAGEATLSNLLASPFIAVTSDFGVPNLGVGVALYAPFGGSATWDRNPDYEGDLQYPGAVDGVARWASIEGTQQALYLSLAGAYRLPGPRIAFGLGINLVRQSISTVRARNTTGTDYLVSSTGSIIEGRSLIDVSGDTLAAGAGVMWQPIDPLVVGLSYQSQPGFGKTTLTGTLTNRYGSGGEEPGPIDLEHSLPDVFRLGGKYQVTPVIEVRLSGDYTRWSVFDRQCLLDQNDPNRKCALAADGSLDTAAGGSGVIVNLPRDWNDTFGVRLGGSYWLRPAVELFAGGSFDSNAVPDETIDAALVDMNKVVASLGTRLGLLDQKLTVIASLTQVVYFQRTTDPRPHDTTTGEAIAPASPSRNPDGAGTYKLAISMLTIGLGYSF